MGRRGTVPHVLHLGTRQGRGQLHTSVSLRLVRRLGGPLSQSGVEEDLGAAGNLTQDHPAHIQSLYRLSYPGTDEIRSRFSLMLLRILHLILTFISTEKKMMVFIQLRCTGVKSQVFALISGVRGMKWRRFQMEQVVPTINRKLPPQGKQNYGSVFIYTIIHRKFCIFHSLIFFM